MRKFQQQQQQQQQQQPQPQPQQQQQQQQQTSLLSTKADALRRFPGSSISKIATIAVLGGGFKDFLFRLLFGEDFQFDSDLYFSKGLKPPTRVYLRFDMLSSYCNTASKPHVFS